MIVIATPQKTLVIIQNGLFITTLDVNNRDDNVINNIRLYSLARKDIFLRFKPPEDHILGFITLRKIFNDYHVMTIVVRKEQRGNGIGELLTIGAFDEAKYNNIDTISLEVSEENSNAINLYKKYGFIKKGLRKNYYNGENALIFTTPRINSYSYTKSLFVNVNDYVQDGSNYFSKKMSNFKRKSIFLNQKQIYKLKFSESSKIFNDSSMYESSFFVFISISGVGFLT